MTMGLSVIDLSRPPVLAPMSFAIRPGEIVGLVGPNGSGKTTLIRALASLTQGPGRILCDGTDVAAMPRHKRAAAIAYMPSERTIGWPMRVRDVVALGCSAIGRCGEAAIDRALTLTDSAAFADRTVDRLSTGERARVLLARALVARPRYALLDEPVANLDPHYQLAILDMLRAEARHGLGVLVVLHDLSLAERHCDRLLLLDGGRLVADGKPAEVLTADHLARTFRLRREDGAWERACVGT